MTKNQLRGPNITPEIVYSEVYLMKFTHLGNLSLLRSSVMSVPTDDLQVIEFLPQTTADFLLLIILVVYHRTLIKQLEVDRNLAE